MENKTSRDVLDPETGREKNPKFGIFTKFPQNSGFIQKIPDREFFVTSTEKSGIIEISDPFPENPFSDDFSKKIPFFFFPLYSTKPIGRTANPEERFLYSH